MNTVPKSGIKTYRIPRLIIDNGSLKTLSGNALALFIYISHRAYRTRLTKVVCSVHELLIKLDLTGAESRAAAIELNKARIFDFMPKRHTFTFDVLKEDGSKADYYLYEPLEPIPNQI